MITLSGAWLLVTVLTLLALGMAAGYALASMRARRDIGGRTPVELKQDYDGYQQKVEKHFVTTNELLERMTAQYREVYAHMADSARDLCSAPDIRIDDHMRLIALEQMRDKRADEARDDGADDKASLDALAVTGAAVAAASTAGADDKEEPYVALDEERAYQQTTMFEDPTFDADAAAEQAAPAHAPPGEQATDIEDRTDTPVAASDEPEPSAFADHADGDAENEDGDGESKTVSKAA